MLPPDIKERMEAAFGLEDGDSHVVCYEKILKAYDKLIAELEQRTREIDSETEKGNHLLRRIELLHETIHDLNNKIS